VFHPIQDLSGKSPAQIAADLRSWFPQEDPITDFNAFFQRAALHVKRNNLVLAPLNVVLFSDGEPDYPGAGRLSMDDKYKRVDLSPLEYLSRNVTVRLLYADPPIAQLWENKVAAKARAPVDAGLGSDERVAAPHGRRRGDGAAGFAVVVGGQGGGRPRAAGAGALKETGKVGEAREG